MSSSQAAIIVDGWSQSCVSSRLPVKRMRRIVNQSLAKCSPMSRVCGKQNFFAAMLVHIAFFNWNLPQARLEVCE